MGPLTVVGLDLKQGRASSGGTSSPRSTRKTSSARSTRDRSLWPIHGDDSRNQQEDGIGDAAAVAETDAYWHGQASDDENVFGKSSKVHSAGLQGRALEPSA
jgi:hypothetical protein